MFFVIYLALFLNNCSFVAHHLLTIDKAFCLKLTAPGTSLPPPGREPKLAELIPKVRRLGNDGFARHIQNKKDEIFQCLSEAEGENQELSDLIAAALDFV